MENWLRGLDKKTALIFGGLSALACVASFKFVGGIFGGAIIGALVGLTVLFFFKGITGMTPKERKEKKEQDKK